MPFLTEVHFQNYRSFLDAKCRLSPVTLVIGANNAGKSHFLGGINLALDLASGDTALIQDLRLEGHWRHKAEEAASRITLRNGARELIVEQMPLETSGLPRSRGELRIESYHLYLLVEVVIGGCFRETDAPSVHGTGMGVSRVLYSLHQEQRVVFTRIMEDFRSYVPEVEDLCFVEPNGEDEEEPGWWSITVKMGGVDQSIPLSNMSNGSVLILALLTIIHQANRPELILIADIERSIHPRGLAPLVETMRTISKEHGVQFIFTTQSPYVLDCFQAKEHWVDVVIVEKRDGVSTLANADERLERLGYEKEMDEVPLGDLWYSGLLGGVANPPEPWNRKP